MPKNMKGFSAIQIEVVDMGIFKSTKVYKYG